MEDQQLLHALSQILPNDKIRARLIDRYAYASDASFYYMVPRVVVHPESVGDIRSLFSVSQRLGVSMTFRAAGTSLSGQSVTDGILVDLSRNWRGIKVEDNGHTVRVQPGAIGGHVNRALKPYGRKIGPDPASINAAMMGGILSNNASGMCCGVVHNAYHTVQSITFVLPDGQSFDTAVPTSYSRFEWEAKNIFEGISKMRRQIWEDAELKARIRSKYQVKNTVGYGLNAFLDYEHPLDILARLMIGGEGTLGFIAEAVLQTIPDNPYKITGLFFFQDARTAAEAILPLKETGAEALEFMDYAALMSIADYPEAPEIIRTLPKGATAILCEYQAETERELNRKFDAAYDVFEQIHLLTRTLFTREAAEQAKLWKLRKGMYPAVAAMRKRGEAVILEDLTFPVPRLGEAVEDLQALFRKHHYENAIIFGHAKDGNLHFVVSQALDHTDVDRYADFMDDLSDLVLKKYDGAFKAEHGTGRNVAPFVETEWGRKAYSIMRQIKRLVDPKNLLNPGVIINDDPTAHLKNLKSLPVVEEEVDKCVECGFCENRCPSRDFTLTPRQRISLRRAVSRLEAEGKPAEAKEIRAQYEFDGIETCAVDGLCALDCPVHINTGDLIKRLRKESHSKITQQLAVSTARNFLHVVRSARWTLKRGHRLNTVFGKKAMPKLTEQLKKNIDIFPVWSEQMPEPPELIAHVPDAPQAVYFATCVSRMMGSSNIGKGSIMETFVRVATRAGIPIFLPTSIGRFCCGQLYDSKGFPDARAYMANQTIEALWQWTEYGRLPIVLDISSCTQSLRAVRPLLSGQNQSYFDRMTIYDSVDFLADVLLPKLNINSRKGKIALHPVCSLHKMNSVDKLIAIAHACAEEVIVPSYAGCCGMAGDRGFIVPELTRSATQREKEELVSHVCDGYYSSSKPCELALTDSVGKPYEAILYLVDEATA